MRNPPRRDVDSSGGMTLASGKTLRMARALHGHHEPTSAELRMARHMAQDGKSWAEIHAAMGWRCQMQTTINRLKKFNIFSRVGTKTQLASKFGGNTRFNQSNTCNFSVWKPRVLA